MYYFDYASTTKISQKNLELYTKLLDDVFLHASSDSKAAGLEEEAKKMIRNSLQLNNDFEVIFTSGGTEANNLAIIGFAQSFANPKHFITSKYEHSSVDSSFAYLEQLGHRVTYLDIDNQGHIDYDQLRDSITNETVMVSVMAVNNEIGTVNDSSTIKSIIAETNPDCLYMADCVQAIGKVKYDYSKLDMLTISGHKLYAPKGIGAVIFKRKINIVNQIKGGQQQAGIRPGTNNVPAEVVLAFAAQTEQAELDNTIKAVNARINQFLEYVNNEPKITLNVGVESNIVSLSFKTKALSESIMTVLLNKQIYASTRSACSTKLNIPSRTLSSIGMSTSAIDRTVRFSFGKHTTASEVDYLIAEIKNILQIY